MTFRLDVPGIVRIAVGQEIDTMRSCVFDHFDILRGFPQTLTVPELDMGMLDRNVRLFANGDFFVRSASKALSASSRIWVM